MNKNLLEKLKSYTVISLDIFDTLLLRTVSEPSEVFLFIWDKILASHINLIDISHREFQIIRIDAERRARNKVSTREISLVDIYNEIPSFILSDKNKAITLEVEAEAECCFCNEDVYQIALSAYQQEKQLVLLSDMYLNHIQIQSLLLSCGINPDIFCHIIISCEQQCSKQNGDLFQILLQMYPHISPQKFFHIGDNLNGDYNQALQAGIYAYHYNIIPDKLYSIFDFEKIRHNIPHKELLSLRKLSLSHYTGNKKYQIAYEIGAAIIGPFLSLYISHVCKRLKALNIHNIYPFMREGWLLGKLLEIEAADKNYILNVHPIYVSRKTTYLASISKVNQEEIENLIGTRNLTIKETLDMLHINLNSFSELEPFFFLPLKETCKINWDDTNVREYFIQKLLKPQHKKIIKNKIEQDRELIISYLFQEIPSFDNIATIDIGFFGRIPMWIENILKIKSVSYKIKHFLGIGITGNKISNGIDIEGFCSTFSENEDLVTIIHRSTDVIEKLISVTSGSTIGYKKENGMILPITDAALPDKEFIDTVFSGIFEFQKLWHKFQKTKPMLAQKSLAARRETLCILHRLIDMPRIEEVEALMEIKADTNFGTSYRKSIITEENIELLEKKGIEYIDKCNVSYSYENTRIVWPKGLVTLKDRFYYVRRTLKNTAQNEILQSMLSVINRMQQDGITETALYGAGENGRQFYFLCQLYHIHVTYFIDRKNSLWGTQKEGIPVVSLQEAINNGTRTYLIASLFSISEIKNYIQIVSDKMNQSYNIYYV